MQDSRVRNALLTYGTAVPCVILVTGSVLGDPRLLLVAPAAIVAWLLVRSPAFRATFFTVGALFVFQTGDALSPTKLAYFAGATFSAVAAVASLHRLEDKDWLRCFRPALLGAGLLAAWMMGPSLVYSLAVQGVPIQAWARDGLTTLLVCYAVVIGVDAAAHFVRPRAHLLVMSVGVLSAFGFAAAWLDRRGFGDPTDPVSGQLLLASIIAPTIPLAFTLVMALSGRGIRPLWLIAGAFIFLAVIVTGTRTGFLLAFAALGILGARRKARIPLPKAIVGASAVAALVAVSIPIAGAAFSSQAFVQQRIATIFEVFDRGFAADQSGLIRQRATSYAAEIWKANPLMGQGVGVTFPNPNPGGLASNYTLDTILTYPAKHGILGTAALLICLLLIFKPLVGRIGGQWLVESTAVRGAVVVWLAILPFGPPTEDKGFAISVALAAVLVGAAYKESTKSPRLDGGAVANAQGAPLALKRGATDKRVRIR